MVNLVVLEYLKKYFGQYDLNALKAKIISRGYSIEDIDEVLSILKKDSTKENKFQNSKLIKIGAIFGIVSMGLLIFFILLDSGIFVITAKFFSPVSWILLSLIFVFLILFFLGFLKFGEKHNNLFIKLTSAILMLIFLIFASVGFYIVIEPNAGLFFSNLFEGINLETGIKNIYAQIMQNSPLFWSIISAWVVSLIFNILFAVGLFKMKEKYSRISGIFHVLGAFFLVIGIGVLFLFASFVIDAVLLFKSEDEL